jgi:hypothetical protein
LNYDEKLAVMLRAFENGLLPGFAVLVPIVAAAGLGVVFLRWLRRDVHAQPLGIAWPLSLVLGFGILGYTADLAYMLRLASPRFVGAVLLAAGIGLLVLMVVKRPVVAEQPRPGTPHPWSETTTLERVLTIVGWSVVLLALLKYYMNTVVPVSDNDSLVHYSVLSRMIANGVPLDDVVLLRKMPITDMNRLVQHLYAQAHMVGGEGAMHLMNFVFFATTLLLVHQFCTQQLRLLPDWSPLPALVALGLFENLTTGYTAKVDYGVAMFEAALAFAIVLRRELGYRTIAVLIGFAVAARVNSMRFAVVVGIVLATDLLIEQLRVSGRGPALRHALQQTSLVGLGAVAIAGPPYLFNQMVYGNPFFPFFNGVLGAYTHWYDQAVFGSQRYAVTGLLTPVLLYLQVCLTRFWQFLRPGESLGGRYALGPLFLLIPFAFERKRWVLVSQALFWLGFLVWAMTAHTHRTLLGVAFLAMPLIVNVICRLRAIPLAYSTTYGAALALTVLTLYAPSDVDYFAYFTGRTTRETFYETTVRSRNAALQPPALSDVEAIRRIAGERRILAVQGLLAAHPALFRTTHVAMPVQDMAARLRDPALDDTDRQVIGSLLGSEYLRERYRSFADSVFSTTTPGPVLDSRRATWRFARAYADVAYFLQDSLSRNPALLVNLMRVQRAPVLVVPAGLRSSELRAVAALHHVWSSATIDVYELREAARGS